MLSNLATIYTKFNTTVYWHSVTRVMLVMGTFLVTKENWHVNDVSRWEDKCGHTGLGWTTLTVTTPSVSWFLIERKLCFDTLISIRNGKEYNITPWFSFNVFNIITTAQRFIKRYLRSYCTSKIHSTPMLFAYVCWPQHPKPQIHQLRFIKF